MQLSERRSEGFTLIELSIVLVIIGLIVGGILVGQDLIKAAEVRAQITQIEKYNQAVNTFQIKFGGIPGNLAAATANQFGFITTSCDGSAAKRDGTGTILGFNSKPYDEAGEPYMFWQDLSSSVAGNLIDGTFPAPGGQVSICNGSMTTWNAAPGVLFAIGTYLPAAKIGYGNFIFASTTNGYNWYTVSATTLNSPMTANATIPVREAYNIDNKMDDGLPTTGGVQAWYVNGSMTNSSPANAASSDTTSTCYNTTSNTYSISSYANYGAGGNCALSFRFQ